MDIGYMLWLRKYERCTAMDCCFRAARMGTQAHWVRLIPGNLVMAAAPLTMHSPV